MDSENVEQQTEETKFFFNGKNFAMGGTTFRETAVIIANEILNGEEKKLLWIELRKIISGDRKPADGDRANILQKAIHMITKKDFSESGYRKL